MRKQKGLFVTDIMQTKTDITGLSLGSVMIGGLFMLGIHWICERTVDRRIKELKKRDETKKD